MNTYTCSFLADVRPNDYNIEQVYLTCLVEVTGDKNPVTPISGLEFDVVDVIIDEAYDINGDIVSISKQMEFNLVSDLDMEEITERASEDYTG